MILVKKINNMFIKYFPFFQNIYNKIKELPTYAISMSYYDSIIEFIDCLMRTVVTQLKSLLSCYETPLKLTE